MKFLCEVCNRKSKFRFEKNGQSVCSNCLYKLEQSEGIPLFRDAIEFQGWFGDGRLGIVNAVTYSVSFWGFNNDPRRDYEDSYRLARKSYHRSILNHQSYKWDDSIKPAYQWIFEKRKS